MQGIIFSGQHTFDHNLGQFIIVLHKISTSNVHIKCPEYPKYVQGGDNLLSYYIKDSLGYEMVNKHQFLLCVAEKGLNVM